jgi:hypothetical protein
MVVGTVSVTTEQSKPLAGTHSGTVPDTIRIVPVPSPCFLPPLLSLSGSGYNVSIMKPVVQEEVTGCAIAAVAAAAGVTYRKSKQAANSLGIFAQDKALWSETNHVRKLLNHFRLGAASKETPFRSWTALPDLALLSTKWHREHGKPFWHWVLFVRENGRSYVLDSKKTLRHHTRRDFGRIKPKWYIGLK